MLVPKLSILSRIAGNFKITKKRVSLYFKAVKNPLKSLFTIYFQSPPWSIVFKDNSSKKLLTKEELYDTVYFYNFPSKGSSVRWLSEDGKEHIQLQTIKSNDGTEVFLGKIYEWLPVKNKTVIDIGANIGDSALYLHMRGAKRVIGFEANKELFDIAMMNLEENEIHSAIILKNETVYGKHSSSEENKYLSRMIEIAPNYDISGRGQTSLTTIKEIVERYNIEDAVLKIDCEGCEYEIILTCERDIIRHFSHIQMEYHFGYSEIKKNLEEKGYTVWASKGKYSKSPSSNLLMKAGDLYAIRNDQLLIHSQISEHD